MIRISSMVHSRRLLRRTPRALQPIIIAFSLVLPGASYAVGPLPSGGHFVAGTGSISGNTTSVTINQSSNRGVINWNSFSIGNGNRVSILNGSGATLNRVTGTNLSSILGTLSATGSVYLVNPQGIVIGSTGVVSTGGRFVATTLNTDNTSFMRGGALTFSGTASGNVVNLGKIASSSGDVFLIASNRAENRGTITAPKGTAELAAGHSVLLQDSSTSRQVFVQQGSGGTVLNAGTIQAAQINLRAADGNIFALAGNHAALRATGTSRRDGHVWLVANTGKVTIDGTAIQARNANGSGGTIDTNGASLQISDDARANAVVTAGQWNITAPSFTIGRLAAPVFARSLGNGTSINLQTTGAHGASGDINVASSMQWFGAASLTLGAYHSLTIEAAAKLKNSGTGNLTLRADSTAIDNGGSVTNNGTVDWSASSGIVSAFYDMNGSYGPGALLANASWTAPAYSGLVTQITGYKLVNSLADLENVSTDLGGNYALGKDIDASEMSTSIGSDNTPFTGQFDGEGHTIGSLSMLVLSYGSPVQAGLFGTLGVNAVVRNLNVAGTTEIAGAYTGGDGVSFPSQGDDGILAADNYGTILRVATSGSIYNGGGWGDFTRAGGLVGANYGTIERSSSSVDVNAGGSLGGLVGENDGIIVQSYASGSTSGVEDCCNPKGYYSQGTAGGLVGSNIGAIIESYATGSVTCNTSYHACAAGGLVNINNGVISQSFASGAVAVLAPPDLNEQGYNGGIAASNGGTIGNDVYWNKDTSGVAVGVGSGPPLPASNGLTTAQMSKPSSFSGWNFSSAGAWVMAAGGSHPILRWQIEPPSGN